MKLIAQVAFVAVGSHAAETMEMDQDSMQMDDGYVFFKLS